MPSGPMTSRSDAEPDQVSAEPMGAHARSSEEVLSELSVDEDTGLDHDAIPERRRRFGPNRLAEGKHVSSWQIVLDQLRSAVVLLLVVAAVAGFAIGKTVEGIAVLVVLVVNTVVGFVTELRAVRSMEALDALATASADVERQDRRDEIDAVELSPVTSCRSKPAIRCPRISA